MKKFKSMQLRVAGGAFVLLALTSTAERPWAGFSWGASIGDSVAAGYRSAYSAVRAAASDAIDYFKTESGADTEALTVSPYGAAGAAAARPAVADKTAPIVFFNLPTQGAIVSGSAVVVSASAWDNVGVIGVQFALDGVNLGAEDVAEPFATMLNSTLISNGSHTLTAVARDAAGNARTAALLFSVTNATANTAPNAAAAPASSSLPALSSSQDSPDLGGGALGTRTSWDFVVLLAILAAGARLRRQAHRRRVRSSTA